MPRKRATVYGHRYSFALGLPRVMWVLLVIVDVALFVVGLFGNRFDFDLCAFVLVIFIRVFGYDVLVGDYDDKMEKARQNLGIDGKGISQEQRREIVLELRRQHLEHVLFKRKKHAVDKPRIKAYWKEH
jgi:hypothetical protein